MKSLVLVFAVAAVSVALLRPEPGRSAAPGRTSGDVSVAIHQMPSPSPSATLGIGSTPPPPPGVSPTPTMGG